VNCDEMAKNRLRQPALGLNVDFSSLNVGPLDLKCRSYGAVKFGYPLKMCDFLLISTNYLTV